MLGLRDDEHTRLAFASESHACYRTGKPKNISVEHQRQFCLEKEHTSCPIFLNAGVKSRKPFTNHSALPIIPDITKVTDPPVSPVPLEDVTLDAGIPEKPYPMPLAARKYAHLWEISGVVIFLIFILVGWWLFNNRDLFFPNNTPVQASIVNTAVPSPTRTNTDVFFPDGALVAELTANPVVQSTKDQLLTPTPTPTSTPSVTPTPSPTSSTFPSLTITPTPQICTAPNGWVLYTVRFGETLSYFANYFGYSIESLMTANCLESEIIVAGQQIYLPWTPYPPTRTPTRTRTSTATNASSASTSTRTPTPTSTLSPTATFTYTVLPNTLTPTQTFTTIPPSPTFTDTPNPTSTFTNTPSPTFSFPPTATPGSG